MGDLCKVQHSKKSVRTGKGKYMLTTSPLSNHHLNFALLQWGHNNYHTKRQTSPEKQGDKQQQQQDTSTPTWRLGLIPPLMPHLRTPAPEPRRLRTLLEGGEFGALSYTWSLPPSSFLTCFWDTSEWHIDVGHSLHQQPTESGTKEDTRPPKQRVVAVHQATQSTFLTRRGPSCTVKGRAVRHKQHTVQHSLTPSWLTQ